MTDDYDELTRQLRELRGTLDAALADAPHLGALRDQLAYVAGAQAKKLRDQIDEGFADATHSRVNLIAGIKKDLLAEMEANGRGLTNHANVQSWVEGWFAHYYARSAAGGGNWCGEWWRHPEAVSRLRAMWRYWEEAQRPGHDMHDWWPYADQQFKELTDSRGTFVSCGPDGHGRTPPPLSTVTVEAGYLHP